MDGDSALDLLVGYTGRGNVGLLTNKGTGALELTKECHFQGAWAASWRVSGVDGDGKQELVGIDENSVYVFPLAD